VFANVIRYAVELEEMPSNPLEALLADYEAGG
jgi:hypothetical protein